MKIVIILILTAIICVSFSMPKSKYFLVQTEVDNLENKQEWGEDYRIDFEEQTHEKMKGDKVEIKSQTSLNLHDQDHQAVSEYPPEVLELFNRKNLRQQLQPGF